MLKFTSFPTIWGITLSWRQSPLPGFFFSLKIPNLQIHTSALLSQTQLVGRRPQHWETFEASHDRHNLHQLCCSAWPCCKERLFSAENVLGILKHDELCARCNLHSLIIFRWEEMEQCSWYLRRCHRDTTGQLLPSQQWWRTEDSARQMDWRATTTGCICCNGSSYSPIQKRAWHPIPSCHHFSQGRWLWPLGCLVSVCWGGCQTHLSLWQGKSHCWTG